MRRSPIIIALVCAPLAASGLAQSSVEIRTGANGQLSGSATAGGVSSTVSTGQPAETRMPDEQGPRADITPCRAGGRSRSISVVAPDGSSSSSASVSGGTVAVAGGGSPGSRIYEEGCPENRIAAEPAPHMAAATVPHRMVRHHAARHRTHRR